MFHLGHRNREYKECGASMVEILILMICVALVAIPAVRVVGFHSGDKYCKPQAGLENRGDANGDYERHQYGFYRQVDGSYGCELITNCQQQEDYYPGMFCDPDLSQPPV